MPSDLHSQTRRVKTRRELCDTIITRGENLLRDRLAELNVFDATNKVSAFVRGELQNSQK